MNTPIKTILAASVLALSSSAFAVDFYIENGVDNSAGGTQVTATSTGLFNSMTYTYWSSTVLTDNGDGVFSAGDTFVSTGGTMNDVTYGIGTDLVSENKITGFDPSWTSGATGPSENGYKDHWTLAFGFDNLQGTIAANGGFIYQSGDIVMSYYNDTTAVWVDVLNLNVDGGTNNGIGQSLDLFGTLSILNGATTIGNGKTVNDLFVLEDGTSFADYLAIDPTFAINWDNDQNTSPYYVNGVYTEDAGDIFGIYGGVANGTGDLAAKHDGSLRFSVPEPAPLALLALGLLGMAGVRKIKAS